ncbi:DDE-type integrase/transposase/recombinase, partial [Leuconostoc falkenbergense]|uniref:DDE-type integrase/transposase/recombinase n=1 Tax=Leuconostoc falkenbergense TaxID=2766470 RepID=UPI0024A94C90
PEANAWSMDITYLKLSNGQWVYLASVLELQTRKILAHQISATMDTKLVVTTLQRSLSTDKKPNYLHTDMGSQFTSFGFENLLKRHKISHSYSKLGHPYDNAQKSINGTIFLPEVKCFNAFSFFLLCCNWSSSTTKINRCLHIGFAKC